MGHGHKRVRYPQDPEPGADSFFCDHGGGKGSQSAHHIMVLRRNDMTCPGCSDYGVSVYGFQGIQVHHPDGPTGFFFDFSGSCQGILHHNAGTEKGSVRSLQNGHRPARLYVRFRVI